MKFNITFIDMMSQPSHELLNQEWLTHCTSQSVNACVRYRFSISSQRHLEPAQIELELNVQKCWLGFFSANRQTDFSSLKYLEMVAEAERGNS